MISSAFRFLTLGILLVLATSPLVSTMKRLAESFSAMTPLQIQSANFHGTGVFPCCVPLPLNNFVVEILETFLDLSHVDILPPGLPALSRRLTVLLWGIWVARLASEDRHDEDSVQS